MSKAKGSKENTIVMGDLKKGLDKFISSVQGDDRHFKINQGTIKDDFCIYSYEVTAGVGFGEKHNVTDPPGIIDDDLRNAFAKFNAHLAVIDEVYKHSGIEVDNIDLLHNHELSLLFTVTSFKIKGGKENESIVLTGHKYVSSAGGRMKVETPQISIDSASSYQWYNELKAAADTVREEVALYKLGKYTATETEETEADTKQTKMTFEVSAGTDQGDWDEFAKSKV